MMYPDVEVRLESSTEEPWTLVGRVTLALKEAGAGADVIERFRQEALGKPYDAIVEVAKWYVTLV